MVAASSFLPRSASSALFARIGVRPDVGQPDARLLHRAFVVQRDLDSHRGRGKIADFAFQLDVSASAPWRRDGNANLGKNLVMLQRRGEQRDKEIVDRNHPFALGSGGDDLRAQRQHGRRMIIRGIAMRKIAADRGQVPHLRIGNDRRRIQQQRILRPHHVRRFQLRFAREPANLQEAAVLLDIRKSGDPIDVDQVAGPRQAQLHHGYKTLSAAQDLGVVSMLLQQGHGFRKCLGPEIFESWRYHGPPLSTSKYR